MRKLKCLIFFNLLSDKFLKLFLLFLILSCSAPSQKEEEKENESINSLPLSDKRETPTNPNHQQPSGRIEKTGGGFIEGTIVHTNSGSDVIQGIRINDDLLGPNKKTDDIERKVKKVYIFQIGQLVKLSVSDETIYVNPEQVFYVSSSSKWIAAKNLKPGIDDLAVWDGTSVGLDQKEIIDGNAWLYDLAFEDEGGYFVGKNKILVASSKVGRL